jgi:hypothetical protein
MVLCDIECRQLDASANCESVALLLEILVLL